MASALYTFFSLSSLLSFTSHFMGASSVLCTTVLCHTNYLWCSLLRNGMLLLRLNVPIVLGWPNLSTGLFYLTLDLRLILASDSK